MYKNIKVEGELKSTFMEVKRQKTGTKEFYKVENGVMLPITEEEFQKETTYAGAQQRIQGDV